MDAQEKLQILAEALEHADDENQMGKIKAIAHEYKGNAGYFGLKELEKIARELDMGFSNDQPQENLIKLTRQLVATVKGIVDESNLMFYGEIIIKKYLRLIYNRKILLKKVSFHEYSKHFVRR